MRLLSMAIHLVLAAAASVRETNGKNHHEEEWTSNLSVSDWNRILFSQGHRQEQVVPELIELPGLSVTVPDQSVPVDILGVSLMLDLTNIVCQDLAIRNDISTNLDLLLPSAVELNFNVRRFDLSCSLDFSYDNNRFLSGSGTANVDLERNSLQAWLRLQSSTGADLVTQAPDQLIVKQCSPNVVITNLSLQSDGVNLVLSVLNTIRRAVSDILAEQLEDVICGFLENEPISSLIFQLTKAFVPFLADTEPRDPAVIEANLILPSGAILVNFRNPESIISQLGDALIETVGGFISGQADTNGDNSLAINGLIQQLLLDENAAFVVDATAVNDLAIVDTALALVRENGVLPGGVEIVGLRMEDILVYGLDSFTRLDAFSEVGDYTLELGFRMESITLVARGELDIVVTDATRAVQTRKVDPFEIEFSVENLDASLALLLGLDENIIKALKIGNLLQLNEIGCILSAIRALQLSFLEVHSIQLAGAPIVRGLEVSELQSLLVRIIDLTYPAVDNLLEEYLPNLIENGVDTFVGQTDLISFLGDPIPCTYKFQPEREDILLDFRDLLLPPAEAIALGGSGSQPYGDLPPTIKEIVDSFSQVDPNTGQPVLVDSVVVPFTLSQSGKVGELHFENFVETSGSVNIQVLGNFTLRVGVNDARFMQLDSLAAPLILADPIANEASLLHNAVAFRSLEMAGTIVVDLETGAQRLVNTFSAVVGLDMLRVTLRLLARISEQALFTFPLNDITNLNCWLALFPAPQLDDLGVRLEQSQPSLSVIDMDVTFDKVRLNVSCVECENESFEDAATFLTEVVASNGASVIDVGGTVIDFQLLVDSVLGLLEGENAVLQVFIDRLLVDAAKFCPHRAEYDPDFEPTTYDSLAFLNDLTFGNATGNRIEVEDESATTLLAAVGVLFVAVSLALIIKFFVARAVARRHRKWLKTLPREQLIELHAAQTRHERVEMILNTSTPPLYRNPQVSFTARILVVFALLLSIGGFLAGIMGTIVEFHISVEITGERLVETVVPFSIGQLVSENWKSGARLSAVLTLIGSCIWPLMKQTLSLAFWMLPTSVLSVSMRSRGFHWMNFLGKWSLTFFFIFLVSSAAYTFRLESQNLLLPVGLYTIDLVYIPVWGFMAIGIAHIIAQVTSYAMIRINDHVIEHVIKTNDPSKDLPQDVKKEDEIIVSAHTENSPPSNGLWSGERTKGSVALCDETFLKPHTSQTLAVRLLTNYVVVAAAFAVVACTIVGSAVPSVSRTINGIVAVAFELQNQETSKSYGIFQIAEQLYDAARFFDENKYYLGVVTLGGFLILTVMVLPILLVMIDLLQWFQPHSIRFRTMLAETSEILESWESLEVYILAVLSCSWQLEDVSKRVVRKYCEQFEGIFSALVSFGLLDQEDGQCFELEAATEYGTFCLIGGLFFMAFLRTLVSTAVEHKKNEMKGDIEKRVAPAESSMSFTKEQLVRKIRPNHSLFTDRFSWLLKGPSR